MCDYCGCRRSGPTSELHEEHLRLLELSDQLESALDDQRDATAIFDEFVDLIQRHSAKEEIGLFVHARESTPLGDQIDTLCQEHTTLHAWLADGPSGGNVARALLLLTNHIDDEEHDVFPHVFHTLDPEQWDEIELAHRAIDAVWKDV